MVKESRHEFKRAEDERDFHQKALITQKAAEDLAKEFNQQAKELGLTGLPEVAYMTCCFIETGKMKSEEGVPAEPKEPAAAEPLRRAAHPRPVPESGIPTSGRW